MQESLSHIGRYRSDLKSRHGWRESILRNDIRKSLFLIWFLGIIPFMAPALIYKSLSNMLWKIGSLGIGEAGKQVVVIRFITQGNGNMSMAFLPRTLSSNKVSLVYLFQLVVSSEVLTRLPGKITTERFQKSIPKFQMGIPPLLIHPPLLDFLRQRKVFNLMVGIRR
ncbi:MAG: hypothetical protein EZS28_039406 [Streblomastix strix]|uniref:Uncharacterized protein n=1 Tax=Streblomastix strix TaxID=222440 RepID=A0A5J4U425_9EUKA|nr:MAG: hypothetical protein EZS28_039406 [Streblomastix strix]